MGGKPGKKVIIRARKKWKLRIYREDTSEEDVVVGDGRQVSLVTEAHRRNRQGFRVTGRLGRRYFMQIDTQRIFGRRKPKKGKGNRRGIRIKPGVWRLKVLKKKCPYPIRFHVRGAQKERASLRARKERGLLLHHQSFGD